MGWIDPRGKIQRESSELYQLNLKKIEGRFLIGYLGLLELVDKRVKVNANRFSIPFDGQDPYPAPSIVQSVGRARSIFLLAQRIFKIGSKESIDPVFIGKDQIISLSKDHGDNLWIGYLQNGAARYQSFNDSKPFRLPFLDSKSVTRVLHDVQKGYWVSTLEDGVYYIPEFVFLNQTISHHTKIKTVFSRDDQTFIGDDSGLVSILDHSGNPIIQKKFNERSILSIFYDSKKNIWVSTNIDTYILD